jgi:heat-inducible transcriptional repressor
VGPIELDDRTRQVLQAVLFEYTLTAEPVGSRQVAKKYALGLSPATIRNVMADLEEFGYLTHPHTSAGRVPTDKAYRFYVDSMGATPLGRPEALHLQRQVAGVRSDIDDLMESTSAQLSALSRYAAVILAPPLQRTRLERVDLIPVEGERALIVLATETGWGTSRILTLEEAVSAAELREVARMLSERFGGRTFQEIRAELGDHHGGAPATDRVSRLAASLARKVFTSLWDRNLYIGGAMNMFDQPEFGDIATIKALLRTFEEKRQLIELLTERAGGVEGVQVVIGSEMPIQELQEASLVAAAYKYRDRVLGVLGVVGPRRMPYAKIVPLVEYTARLVSRRLARLAHTEPVG